MANLFNHAYPYLDEHELNLDWLIAKMKELIKDFDEFKVVNNITFSGQWDITKQYPAWTIVSDNNIGYVSIQPVPVGVPLSNGNYWVEVIDYTAQIAGLENRVIALENTVGDASSGLVHDVDELQTDMAAITPLVEKHQFNNLKDARFVAITDSFGVYQNANGRNFLEEVQNILGISNDNFFIDYHGSYGFKNDEFLSILQGMTITDPDSIDYVICVGGNNDRGSTAAQIQTGIKNFCDYTRTNFPKAKIVIGYDAWNENMAGIYADRAYTEYKNSCGINNAEFADMQSALHRFGLTSDGIHPTASGVDRLTASLMNYLTGKDGFLPITTEFVQFTSTIITSADWYISNQLISESVVVFATKPINWTLNGQNFNNTSIINVATITDAMFNFYNTNYPMLNVLIDVTSNGNVYADCKFEMAIVGGALYLRNVNGAHLPNVTAMTIKRFYHSIPSAWC